MSTEWKPITRVRLSIEDGGNTIELGGPMEKRYADMGIVEVRIVGRPGVFRSQSADGAIMWCLANRAAPEVFEHLRWRRVDPQARDYPIPSGVSCMWRRDTDGLTFQGYHDHRNVYRGYDRERPMCAVADARWMVMPGDEFPLEG